MRKVDPKVFVVGETRIVDEGLRDYFAHIGVPEWTSDAPTEVEKLIEVYGRLCYNSFKPGLNPNVTRVREGNREYLANISNVKHGAVIEHGSVNFIFADVSRVFTHELVRHRTGVAISQESLRFVRLENLGQWLPTVIREDEEAVTIFANTFELLEKLQLDLAAHFNLDGEGVSFKTKKKITSAMRRIAPLGLATNIGWTANFRTLRWVIELRTAPDAEEEIRVVFGKVADICIARYPNLFSDFTCEDVDGLPWYKPANSKI